MRGMHLGVVKHNKTPRLRFVNTAVVWFGVDSRNAATQKPDGSVTCEF